MTYNVVLTQDGRINQATPIMDGNDTILTGDVIQIEIAENIDRESYHHYRVVDGELVYDPLPEPEPPPSAGFTPAELTELISLMLGGAD